MVRPPVKSGRLLTRSVSLPVPRLIVSVPVGLLKSVCSIELPLRRDSVLLAPSSASVMLFVALVGRFTVTLASVPVLVIGERFA